MIQVFSCKRKIVWLFLSKVIISYYSLALRNKKWNGNHHNKANTTARGDQFGGLKTWALAITIFHYLIQFPPRHPHQILACNLVRKMDDQLKRWDRPEGTASMREQRWKDSRQSSFCRCSQSKIEGPSTGVHQLLWRAVELHFWCGCIVLHYACHIEPNQ